MNIYDSLKDNEKIKPCPFCGSREHLRIESAALFNRVKKKYGRAKVGMECSRCNIEMNVFCHDIGGESNYAAQKKLLLKRWNERAVPK